MVYKNTSCKSVLAKIYRDLKPGYSGWEADAIEWIGEAMDYMGCSSGFEKHSESISVVNHRAILPANFYTLRGVYYEGEKLPFGGAYNNVQNFFAMEITPQTPQTAVTDPNAVTLISPNQYEGDYYIINPNYIQTSFETGEIIVLYYRYPIDEDGLPMIPDNITVKTAMVWYVLMQMLMSGSITSQFSYKDAQQMWKEKLIQAQNDVMFPSPDKAERFREMWVRMLPDTNWKTDEAFELDYDQNPEE